MAEKEKEYEEQLKDYKKLMGIKGRYILEMTRQMRTPMNIISGMIEISQNNVTDSHKVADCLDKMNEASRTIEFLVEKIQHLAYLNDEVILGEPSQVRIEELALNAARKVIEERGELDGRIHVDCHLPHPVVSVDARHLTMALCSVIMEAVRFIQPDADITLHINEKITTGDGRGIYEIWIDKPKSSRGVTLVSDADYESEITVTRARMALQALGGSLDVSAIGEQDRFRVTLILPIGAEADLDMGEVDIDNIDFWGMRVLVAEDNVLNMQVMEDPLKSRGIMVTKAWNGREALEAFKNAGEAGFDLVILDIKMPEMNGYETAKAIRSLGGEDANDVIIFTVTDEDGEGAVKKVHDAGIDRYFLKPINVAEILREYIRMTE